MPKYTTDADRLRFLLTFFSIEDIGDEDFTPGVCVRSDELEDALTWRRIGKSVRRNLCERVPFDLDAFRRHIDAAMLERGES
jgi:hypothetical protein